MTETYKLLRVFPGSPLVGSLVILDDDNKDVFEIFTPEGQSTGEYIGSSYIVDSPAYWQLLMPEEKEAALKAVIINISDMEYEALAKLVRNAIQANIHISEYRDAKLFLEEFEDSNYLIGDLTLKIPKGLVNVFSNSLGSIIYSHKEISLSKRKELKVILNKIEHEHDYILDITKSKMESPFANLFKSVTKLFG